MQRSAEQWSATLCSAVYQSKLHWCAVQWFEVSCSLVECSLSIYSTVQFSAVHCSAVNQTTVQCSIMQRLPPSKDNRWALCERKLGWIGSGVDIRTIGQCQVYCHSISTQTAAALCRSRPSIEWSHEVPICISIDLTNHKIGQKTTELLEPKTNQLGLLP